MAYKDTLYWENTDLKKPSLFKNLMNWIKSTFRRKKVFDLDVKRERNKLAGGDVLFS